MIKRERAYSRDVLVDHVVTGMMEKKGRRIAVIDLRQIGNSVCDYFVVCHGSSTVNVDAIADSVEEEVLKNGGEKPRHTEGKSECNWIVLDYFDVMVHIFREDIREHYNIEDLWADAEVQFITQE